MKKNSTESKKAEISRISLALEKQMPGWNLDAALEFGSSARDEDATNSDVDIWMIGHSDGIIYFDVELGERSLRRQLDRLSGEI